MEYKVKSLVVEGAKKIFNSGEIVSDKDFPEGEAKALAKEGYLKEFKKQEVKSS